MTDDLEKRVFTLEYRMDETWNRLNDSIDSVRLDLQNLHSDVRGLHSRIDEMGYQLNGRIDALGQQLNSRMDSLQHTMVVQTRWILALGGFLAIALPITFRLAEQWM